MILYASKHALFNGICHVMKIIMDRPEIPKRLVSLGVSAPPGADPKRLFMILARFRHEFDINMLGLRQATRWYNASLAKLIFT